MRRRLLLVEVAACNCMSTYKNSACVVQWTNLFSHLTSSQSMCTLCRRREMLHVSSVQKGRTNLRTSGAVGLHITKNGPRRQYELLLPVHEDDILRLKDCVNAQRKAAGEECTEDTWLLGIMFLIVQCGRKRRRSEKKRRLRLSQQKGGHST